MNVTIEAIELESLLEESSLQCLCNHRSNPLVPGNHYLDGINHEDGNSCEGNAVWICFEAEARENKRPVYLCEDCMRFWHAPPFSLLREPLK